MDGRPGARERALREATLLFADRGYAGTSIQAIADAVGIRKASLLHHFPNKEALRDAVLEAVIDAWLQQVAPMVGRAPEGHARFDALFDLLFNFYREHPARARLVARETLDRPEAMSALFREHMGPLLEIVGSAIRQGQAAGLLQPQADPEAWLLTMIQLAVWTTAIQPSTAHNIPENVDASRGFAELRRIAHDSIFVPRSSTQQRVAAAAEQAAIEARLLQAQKLESLGRLAGGVAHEFNNLLASMVAHVELTTMSLPAGHDAQPMLEQVLETAGRAAELTRQLQAYGGHPPTEQGVLDLSARIAKLRGLMTARLSRKVVLELDLQPSATVHGNKAQLVHATMCLVDNASDALPDGGAVSIRTRIEVLDEADLEGANLPAIPPPPGRYVVVEVSDTGVGMDAETVEQAFEPFYTTYGGRRGLGLSAVAGTVQGHRGAVWIDSLPGEGTTVRLVLPWHEAGPVEPHAPRPPVATSTHTILVVDDEEGVRTGLALLLEHSGYTVHTAADGQQGHERFVALADTLSLIVLDMNMPRLGGIEVYEVVRATHPHIPILFTSGYTEADPRALFPDDPRIGFLHKPFPAKRLAHEVGKLIA